MIMTLLLQPSHSHSHSTTNNLHFHSFAQNQTPDFRVSSAMDSASTPSTRSRSGLNHDIFRTWNGKQIRLKDDDAAVEYGFRSSPQFSPRSYRSLSPPAKALAVATGQKELMEIVNNMPECCYELSLRDLVEQPMVLGAPEETLTDDRLFDLGGGDREVFARENRRSKRESRPPSALVENGGLYLKMGLPKSIGAKTSATARKKKVDSGMNMSAKVSPKPTLSSENNGNTKSNSSGSHGSTKNRAKATDRHESGGCWSCIYPKYNERDE